MTAIDTHQHPVTRALAGVRRELSSVAEAPVLSMAPEETVAAIQDVHAAEAQLAELKARLVRQAETLDVPGQAGATSTANWLAHQTKVTRRAAFATTRLATSLEVHEPTRRALAQGSIHVEQAEVILRSVDDLPDNLPDPEAAAKAEQHLLAEAAHFDAKTLRVLGRHLLQAIAPEAADAHLATLLEREEREARAATRLTMWEDADGRLHGRFTLPKVEGAAFKKAILAFAAPKHRASQGPLGERRPTPERLGQAFGEYVTRYPSTKLAKAGGLNATVVVTIPYDTLIGGLKAAQLDTGQTISASEARRLACEAGIIPAVLGGDSKVLDLGRTRRFHNRDQRIVATIEQRGCAVEGCDMPPGMTHLHHPTPWSQGGETNRDAVMICPGHHRRAHDPLFEMVKQPNGKYVFHRRT